MTKREKNQAAQSGSTQPEELQQLKKLKVRGVATIDPATNKFAFAPYNEAPPAKADVRTYRGGKCWVTTGADPSRMITLKCKENAADMYADFVAQFHALTKDMKPKKPVQKPDSQRVVKEEGLQCWLDEAKGEMTFTGTINLAQHPRDWQAETLRLVQLVVRRLPASERFNKMINHVKKGGLNHA